MTLDEMYKTKGMIVTQLELFQGELQKLNKLIVEELQKTVQQLKPVTEVKPEEQK